MNDPQWTLENEPLRLTREQTNELVLRHGEDKALAMIHRYVMHALKSVKLKARQ